MGDNKYPEYEEHVGMACESTAAPTTAPYSHNGVATVHDEIDDLDWDRFSGFGPSTDEEALERIAAFEDKLSKNQVNWTSSEEFDKLLFEEFPWLR